MKNSQTQEGEFVEFHVNPEHSNRTQGSHAASTGSVSDNDQPLQATPLPGQPWQHSHGHRQVIVAIWKSSSANHPTGTGSKTLTRVSDNSAQRTRETWKDLCRWFGCSYQVAAVIKGPARQSKLLQNTHTHIHTHSTG